VKATSAVRLLSLTTMAALSAFAALTALAACGPSAAPSSGPAPVVTVADVLCRPTPNGRQATACYVTLTANTDDSLVSVSSPRADRVEIHESKLENGMMVMTELRAGQPLPAGQKVELKPGGNHIMLLGVAEPLATGQTVDLTLTFANAPAVEVTAPVAHPPVEAAN
jgi:copper(I)-binding protein